MQNLTPKEFVMSDLHVAAAGLIKLVDEPGSLEDYSLAVEGVRDALAAEDAAGGPVDTPAPVVAAPEVPSPVLSTFDVTPPAPEPVPAAPEVPPVADPAHDAAVAAVAPVVEAVVSPPAAVAPDAHAAALAAAHSDLDAALAQWPDSPQLQDLKAQLDALAA